jgi:hypothetical protein
MVFCVIIADPCKYSPKVKALLSLSMLLQVVISRESINGTGFCWLSNEQSTKQECERSRRPVLFDYPSNKFPGTTYLLSSASSKNAMLHISRKHSTVSDCDTYLHCYMHRHCHLQHHLLYPASNLTPKISSHLQTLINYPKPNKTGPTAP